MKVMVGDTFANIEIRETESHMYVSWKWLKPDSRQKELQAEIKGMQGARWMGFDESNPTKEWRIDKCPRNDFQLAYLRGENPYQWYDRPLVQVPIEPRHTIKGIIDPYTHQKEMIWQGLMYRQTLLAAEMGVGKSLASIIIMEMSKVSDWWYIGTKSSLASVRSELRFWRSKVMPLMFTYDELKKVIANWPRGKKPPQGIVGDELSRVKNEMAARSQAMMHLCNSMRQEYGRECYIIGMSGSPAPKDPSDWWHLCELHNPGFLKEGSAKKLKERLALIKYEESLTGGKYPKLITWKDSELKCDVCGKVKEEHKPATVFYSPDHSFTPMINEVAKLYRRMGGLVLVKLKKDCLDLPAKVYKTIKCEPDKSLLRTAKLIKSGAKRAIEALTLMRELSDGFQYREKLLKTEDCKLCINGFVQGTEDTEEQVPCGPCSGTGKIRTVEREIIEIASEKDVVLLDELENHDDDGRIVIYAGFTASIDRCANLCRKAGWKVIQFDGRGLKTDLEANDLVEAVQQFQTKDDRKIAFVGHPGSAGMGLTLTASDTIVYFSNDFNGEYRIQSEDRIHRIGMRESATIIDIINLPSDELVLKNLMLKKTLQSISLGELEDSLKDNDGAPIRA